jgi:hypothetical protein
MSFPPKVVVPGPQRSWEVHVFESLQFFGLTEEIAREQADAEMARDFEAIPVTGDVPEFALMDGLPL